MKKTHIGFLVAVVVLLGAYFVLKIDKNNQVVTENKNVAVYSSTELGLEFSYPTGSEGYVLEEVTPADTGAGLLRAIVLMQSEDADRDMPVGGEGPATITITVFKNTQKQQSQAWANAHVQYSNINLKTGDTAEVVVGGANAIRYMADGLYASENVVVAHGENVYVFSGMFLDENSELRRDFSPLVESVRFIPSPGQE